MINEIRFWRLAMSPNTIYELQTEKNGIFFFVFYMFESPLQPIDVFDRWIALPEKLVNEVFEPKP